MVLATLANVDFRGDLRVPDDEEDVFASTSSDEGCTEATDAAGVMGHLFSTR